MQQHCIMFENTVVSFVYFKNYFTNNAPKLFCILHLNIFVLNLFIYKTSSKEIIVLEYGNRKCFKQNQVKLYCVVRTRSLFEI